MVDFAPFCYKGDNFCDFLFASLYTEPILIKKSITIEGNGADSSLL